MIWAPIFLFVNRLPAIIVGPVVAAAVLSSTLFGVQKWNAWIHDPAVRREALRGYVEKSKLDTKQAQLDEAVRQNAEGEKTLARLQADLSVQDDETKALQAKLDEQVTAYENRIDKMDGNCRLTEPDIGWVLKP